MVKLSQPYMTTGKPCLTGRTFINKGKGGDFGKIEGICLSEKWLVWLYKALQALIFFFFNRSPKSIMLKFPNFCILAIS